MSTCSHWDCNLRNSSGYCVLTACCHPRYRYDLVKRAKCECGYEFVNSMFKYCPYCGRKREWQRNM